MSATSMVIGFEGRRATPRLRTPRRTAPCATGSTRLAPASSASPVAPAAAAAPARTAPAAPAAPAGSLRLTRRGRLLLTMILTCLVVAAFVVAGGASVATREGGVAEQVRIIEVEQGQTLWQIAGSVAAPGETGEMVYRIRELNSLPGSSLVEGQELAVPLP